MKLFAASLVCVWLLSGVSYAQAPGTEKTGYVSGVAQSAFGNVTSQSFGVEGGWYRTPALTVFVELGAVRDAAPDTVGPKAQIIAGVLTQVQTAAVAYAVRQPLAFVSGGVRMQSGRPGAFHPYVLVGAGVARVTRDVTFRVGGADVTDSLGVYGIVLGTDLAGSTTEPMITAGGGVTWQPKGPWIFDAGYRFSYIATDTSATNVNRVGLGVGYAF